MNDLTVLDLYNEADDEHLKGFSQGMSSSLRVKTDYSKVDRNYEWLEKMEECIRYLDNILRNPNRFIVNEEDVVKIELARRITVDSIKHLARNTNLIQDIDPVTEEVKPAKILNINKEESFDTYENRFIYSLIKNMQFYIERKKRHVLTDSPFRNNKSLEYEAVAKLGNEKVDVSLSVDSKSSGDGTIVKDENTSPEAITRRLEKLENQITDLTSTEVYKNLSRAHVALVTSPIKKTNVILKNTNFQYALELWNYLQNNVDNDTAETKDKQDYNDTGHLKRMIDETVLLDYLVIDSINNQKQGKKTSTRQVSERIVANMVEKIMDVDSSLNEEQLKDIVSKQYSVIKYRSVINDQEIQKKFKKHINEYLKRISEAKL